MVASKTGGNIAVDQVLPPTPHERLLTTRGQTPLASDSEPHQSLGSALLRC